MSDVMGIGAVGALLVLAFVFGLHRARTTSRWRKVEASVEAVKDRSRGFVEAGPYLGDPSASYECVYEARVRFETDDGPAEATVFLDQLPGSQILIYYNPRHPSSVQLTSHRMLRRAW